ncbi:MAG: HD domain-containing protein [Solirubrobacterales bacterium]|nr:HD domain-containing protein [Solirubrobacterales bacterium]
MSDALAAAREALAGARAWVVGGAVRDALLGRDVDDVDVVVDGDVAAAAKALGRHAGGPAFALSDTFGAWRVIGPDRRWQVDLMPVQGGGLHADLARRDFTVNAMAEPLAGGALEDPFHGREDLAARRLRMVTPIAFDDDPLRVLRLARFACELGFGTDPGTVEAARHAARAIADVAGERVFAELRRVVAADTALDGLALMDDLGLTAHVLPELAAMRGVAQNRYHHLDVHDHTLAVLEEAIRLEREPAAVLGDDAVGARVRAFLAEPFADGLTRGGALRFGALLHDVAKPETQARDEHGEVLGFPGHAELGACEAREVLARLRTSERLRAHVAALTRHHLGLGFLTHRAPLQRRDLFKYLMKTQPVPVDVSLLSIADRLATRGRKAQEAIERHLALARVVLPEALDFDPRAAPLVRGDELAAALGVQPGRELGRLLLEVAEARFAGEVATRDEAVALGGAREVPRAVARQDLVEEPERGGSPCGSRGAAAPGRRWRT